MPWTSDPASLIEWLASEDTVASPIEDIGKSFDDLGGSVSSFLDWFAQGVGTGIGAAIQAQNDPDAPPVLGGPQFEAIKKYVGSLLATQIQQPQPAQVTDQQQAQQQLPDPLSGLPYLAQTNYPTNKFGTDYVPPPFNSEFFQDISQSFGENGEQGTDWALPVGQEIVTPVGGQIYTRDDGKANWGKAVYVQMPNGWTFFVGHLSQFSVSDGETVGPGDTLGLSGGDPNDPSSGHSDGAHIEIRFIDPSGNNQDPMPILTPVFSGTGTTFNAWQGGVFASSAFPSPFPQKIVRTPDNQWLDLNTPDGQWYQTVNSIWTSMYGTPAPLQAATDFRNAGLNTVDAVQNAIDQMPSSIAGVNIGTYQGIYKAAQAQAQQAFGRPIPQSLVSQFAHSGITTPSDIKLWFLNHSSSDIPKEEYQQVFDHAAPYTRQLSQDVPHPDDIAEIHKRASLATLKTDTFPFAVT